MPLITNLSLAMRTDILALIRGVSEFFTVIYGPAVTLAFSDAKMETWVRSVLHLNLISLVEGSTLNCCEQDTLREAMSEEYLFAKIAEPDMTALNFNNHFRDRMGELNKGHPYGKTNGEITNISRLIVSYKKVRKGNDGRGVHEKVPKSPSFRSMLLGAESVAHTPKVRASDTNDRRMANFFYSMDPCTDGRNAAMLQYTQLAYVKDSTKRRMSNAATPKSGRFEEDWRQLQ